MSICIHQSHAVIEDGRNARYVRTRVLDTPYGAKPFMLVMDSAMGDGLRKHWRTIRRLPCETPEEARDRSRETIGELRRHGGGKPGLTVVRSA